MCAVNVPFCLDLMHRLELSVQKFSDMIQYDQPLPWSTAELCQICNNMLHKIFQWHLGREEAPNYPANSPSETLRTTLRWSSVINCITMNALRLCESRLVFLREGHMDELDGIVETDANT